MDTHQAMTSAGSIYRTFNRYRTLKTHLISSLPIVILMPHSACNCRCAMCDIWKGNQHLRQLTEKDIEGLLAALKKFGTQQVVMSGGEALLNPNFFRFCEILKKLRVKITLLSTGLTIKKNAALLTRWVDEIIISLDGDEPLHDAIRNIPGAFHKIREGIIALRSIDPHYRVSGRTVIHRLNFHNWPNIIDAARSIGLDSISFLPADVSSTAFNRETLWDTARQDQILLSRDDLEQMRIVLDHILREYAHDLKSGFIAEPAEKLRKIHMHYAAWHGLNEFPDKKCNAPWVSAVIEADGAVRPCFFHPAHGNIHDGPLHDIINGEQAIAFRKNLDIGANPTCAKCVCHLNLSPLTNISRQQ